VARLQTDKNGSFEVGIDRNTDYTVNIKKENYIEESKNVTSKSIDKNATSIKADFILNPVAIKPISVVAIAELPNIYFDYNKFKISKASMAELDNIAYLMINTYPNMVIKIESHTDSRGSSKYNDALSAKRAYATYDYLVSKGIDAPRITDYKGYGEQQLLNDCDDTSKCTEAQHQQNRRTQITVVKME
jgi:outer membrane protein OmpA-like peptidoglycan-associated protein